MNATLSNNATVVKQLSSNLIRLGLNSTIMEEEGDVSWSMMKAHSETLTTKERDMVEGEVIIIVEERPSMMVSLELS